MKPLHSLLTLNEMLYRWKLLHLSISNNLQTFLFSLESYVALGLFATSTAALVTHKFTVILLHRPLGFLFLFYWPFLFGFDLTTLLLLHHALKSASQVWRLLASIFCVVIVFCSATFVSLFLEANTPTNWGRSIEVRHPQECPDLDYFKLEHVR